ncbi:PQQ-dependent dehydrogenase, methanol/ethanol family [Pacificimonas flava]|uniref:PQQ-dependent dehydrogenase, methanol/ethanol family n=2 Tax=Pacificimonas TaxID=1960290 RepID=A0A219B8R2_9SPHN|nr:PQQ-dependent dehydrogenase, methanol/ethanol family [Pacificimonas aurantium]MBZ6378687.1 PQQ-dependent dehydrogenase, methanol/ethanol family [Pacificimonas aurantium]OWV34755.1 PQQ-dependent dehydrogenase, methanol/ethanol family [Pacificimonas flava]
MSLIACTGASERPAEIEAVRSETTPSAAGSGITGDDIQAAASSGREWMSYGLGYDEKRHSPLRQVNSDTVSGLGLTWFADLDTSRGQEATPLHIDGTLYVTTAWSMVKAFDATTGALLWEYDPGVDRARGVMACCDVVNRGVAAWGDKLFMGALDGRLIALDRKTGEEVWSTVTVDQSKPYTITGAPRVVNGKVLIGNGGAEFGVRGYLGAYDAETGEEVWRFYTVPGEPGVADDPAYLQKAAETWSGEWWDLGGGGTVWDSMAYDPDLDLLYIGVGNGSPWNQIYRSPEGGDNLYLSSIVALRPDTGEYVWHFQTTPGETWDYTATQHIILADLTMTDGSVRKALMQAPKNGFFYTIDRETGEFISGDNYVAINWASGLDENGRPIEVEGARYTEEGETKLTMPGPLGGHNWHPMAYNPNRQLVFIPAMNTAFPYMHGEDWEAKPIGFNVGLDTAANMLPADKAARDEAEQMSSGMLLAWDPVAQKEVWRVDHRGPWNGGILSTAGDLVFQGNSSGVFAAYSAADGRKMWDFPAQTGIVAAPMSYELDGEQYVAVLAGWGGAFPISAGYVSTDGGVVPNVSRLLVFKLGGQATLPPAPELNDLPIDPPPSRATTDVIALGKRNFGQYCSVCHGDAAIGGTVIPDLRRSATLGNRETWLAIVRDGLLSSNGMVGFSEVMTKDEIDAVRQYVIARANEDRIVGDRAAAED